MIESFMEVVGISRMVEIAELLDVKRQTVYNLKKNNLSVNVGQLTKMISYMQKEGIDFNINYTSEGEIYFTK